tara:strand:+ start:9825 stop:11522 length:1698 start_codon:yes stop_codon:yes gene_type:complete
MVDMYIPEQEEDENLTQQYHDYAKAGTMDVLGATFNETLYYNPANALGRLSEQYIGKGTEGSTLSKDAWASSDYFREGIEVGEEGIKEGLAQLLSERHDERLDFRTTLGRSRGGFGLGAAQFGVSLAGSMLDPLNVASAFIPSVALGRMATTASRTGSKRFMTGAMDGAVGAAIVEPLVIGAAAAEQDRDYRLMDSFLNVAVGAALGGSLFYGVGKLSDRLRKLPPKSKEQAQNTAIGQVLQDQEVNVTSVVRDGEAVASAKSSVREGSIKIKRTATDTDYYGTTYAKYHQKAADKDRVDAENYLNNFMGPDALDNLDVQGIPDLADKILAKNIGNMKGQTASASDVSFKPEELQDTKGLMQEEVYRDNSPKLDILKKNIQKKGYEPQNIQIVVREDGTPFIFEGNHRLAEALQSNRAEIKADIIYLRDAEKSEGPMSSQSLSQQVAPTSVVRDGETVTQQQADAPVTEAQEVQPEPSNLGRLAEYSDDVDEIKSQSLKQDEFDANAIEQENQVLLSEVTTEENLAMLPAEARQSLEEITDLEASAENIENYVEAGRACIVRSQG